MLKVKCKPTFNFQSIEFETEIDETNPRDFEQLKTLYSSFVQILKDVAPTQEETPKGSEKLASPAQLSILDRFNIPYNKGITAMDAGRLIEENMKRSR